MTTRFGQGALKLQLKPGAARKIGDLILRALKDQAAKGLAPAKRGGQVTLHEVHGGSIWRDVDIADDGTIEFRSPVAFLLEQYGGDQLRPETYAEIEGELAELLAEGLEQADGEN
jgi:hypothetical protein